MNLSQYLTLHIPPLMERIRLFTEICVTVCSLHASGLMHGAIAPEHILVTLSSDSTGELASFHQVKLCHLACCRRIGDAFPVNATSDGLMMHSGYIAPEVFFGRVGLCRATTKIDAFTLSLIGYTLLSRKPSVLKHIFPVLSQSEEQDEEMKTSLRDQERVNDMIYTNLDSPLSDIILSICQLNPGDRCDIETVVNMLQIRNSDIQSDLSSLMSLGDMYDELFSKLLANLLDVKQFLVFESGGYQIFLTMMQALHALTARPQTGARDSTHSSTQGNDSFTAPAVSPTLPSGRSTSPAPVAPMQLTEFHQSLAHFSAYLRRRGYTEDPLSSRLSLAEPEEFPEERLLNQIIDLVAESQLTMATSLIREKITSLVSQLAPIETEIVSQRTIVCLYGDAVGRSLSHPSHLKYFKLLESRELWMDPVTSDQVDEMRNNILKMNASLHAVKNINRGLVQFMSNELANLQRAHLDLVKRCYSVPAYCILLPCVSHSASAASLRIKRNTFRLQFLCSHTHQLLPSHLLSQGSGGGEIILSLDHLSRESVSPVALTCLSVLRHALTSNPKLQESLIPGLLPAEITDPSCQLRFLDCAYHLLHTNSIYAPRLVDDQPPEIDLGPLDGISSLESAAYPAAVLTAEIAKFSYRKLTNLIKEQNPALDLASGAVGLRLVTSEKKKFGWIIDSDDIETRYVLRS
jgi:serine/threonine protein kinase